ncbi:type I toxin-antitoxin system SymE family toxin [Scandinavium sp. TWS1a]|uniref:SymE family type I addiction module toxin n=1 Tax=Scandinavium tedordense TaxID=2926521 RepID=UPI0013590289|nr:SymE family type I addiction module toxin [Scandinavium tedordense]MCS2168900.1 type I toxin-antitoxin system SymE family toxin [Scandinavium tedordense]
MNLPNASGLNAVKKARQIKVSYVRKRHQDPKTGRTRHYSSHPSLVLSGNWLEQAGFPTGVNVCVSVQYGQLILKPQYSAITLSIEA